MKRPSKNLKFYPNFFTKFRTLSYNLNLSGYNKYFCRTAFKACVIAVLALAEERERVLNNDRWIRLLSAGENSILSLLGSENKSRRAFPYERIFGQSAEMLNVIKENLLLSFKNPHEINNQSNTYSLAKHVPLSLNWINAFWFFLGLCFLEIAYLCLQRDL